MRMKTRLILIIAGIAYFACCASAQAYKLPDTGQKVCYDSVSPYSEVPCAGSGQDGAYYINPPSYSSSMLDYNTSLSWHADNGNSYNYYEAAGIYNATYNPSTTSVCGELGSGWRLPTTGEMVSMINYGIEWPGPMCSFGCTGTSSYYYYWTSEAGWDADLTMGSITTTTYTSGGAMHVICVKGDEVTPGYTDNGDDTVTETLTGLIWQKTEPGAMIWGDALTYCNTLTLGDNSDWRLPNVKELRSLYSDLTGSYFPNLHTSFYWSSTTAMYLNAPIGTKSAFRVSFENGLTGNHFKTEANYVRCVRGGGSCTGYPVEINESQKDYLTVQSAYDAASNGNTLLMQKQLIQVEDLSLAGDINVTLKGGYNCAFSNQSGHSTLYGSVAIGGSGAVKMDNLIIK
jgi:hypothetical protein